MINNVVARIDYLHCNDCGKQVSTSYLPIETDTPDKGLIIRAGIQCPECLEKFVEKIKEEYNPAHDTNQVKD